MHRSAAEAMLVATVTLWALNFTVSKYILDKGFHPLAYSSIRYAAAALIFFALTIAIEGTVRLARKDVVLAAFATFVLLLNQLCFIYALRFTTATTVALLFGIFSCTSVAVTVLGRCVSHSSGRNEPTVPGTAGCCASETK